MIQEAQGLNLVKGEKTDLTKTNPGLTEINVGLGWDAKTGSGDEFDLDAFAVLLKAGKVYNSNSIIFFNHKKDLGLEHMGDNLTGAGDGDDETIKVYLDKVPADVDEIVLAVNIYEAAQRHERFGQVKNAFIRVYDAHTPAIQILKFDLTEDYSSKTGVLMGKLYRHEAEWKFEAIGEGVDGDINEISSRYH